MEPVTLTIVAAVLGVASSRLGAALKGYFSSRKKSNIEIVGPTGEKVTLSNSDAENDNPSQIKKALLFKMLHDPKYRLGPEFGTLQSAIGSSEDETRELLIQLGARHSIRPDGRDTWTLRAVIGNE